MKRRLFALVLALSLLLSAAMPALAAAPAVKDADYEGNGRVEVDFKGKRVSYKKTKVTVTDAQGKAHDVKILKKDDDDITFAVDGLEAGASYDYTISGVRSGKSGSYGSVSGSFKVPGNVPTIKEIDYDPEDRELEVEFATKVQYKKLKVTVKDAATGKKLTVKKIEKDSDSVELKVKGVKPGRTYTVVVSGVRVKGKKSYTKATGQFTGR